MFTALKEKKIMITHFLCLVYCRWLSVRLEFLGNLMVFFAALFVVLAGNAVSSSTVGLAISYALNVSHGIIFLLLLHSIWKGKNRYKEVELPCSSFNSGKLHSNYCSTVNLEDIRIIRIYLQIKLIRLCMVCYFNYYVKSRVRNQVICNYISYLISCSSSFTEHCMRMLT